MREKRLKPWKKIKTEGIDNYPFFAVHRDSVLSPGGEERKYSWIEMNRHFVMIVPIGNDGGIWLVRQHRYPIDRYVIELPGGVVDSGEDYLEAAKRELEEEVRLRTGKWIPLGPIEEMGVTAKAIGYAYAALDVKIVSNPRKDPLDKNLFEVLQFSWPAIKNMISRDEINDTATITALFKAELAGAFSPMV